VQQVTLAHGLLVIGTLCKGGPVVRNLSCFDETFKQSLQVYRPGNSGLEHLVTFHPSKPPHPFVPYANSKIAENKNQKAYDKSKFFQLGLGPKQIAPQRPDQDTFAGEFTVGPQHLYMPYGGGIIRRFSVESPDPQGVGELTSLPAGGKPINVWLKASPTKTECCKGGETVEKTRENCGMSHNASIADFRCTTNPPKPRFTVWHSDPDHPAGVPYWAGVSSSYLQHAWERSPDYPNITAREAEILLSEVVPAGKLYIPKHKTKILKSFYDKNSLMNADHLMNTDHLLTPIDKNLVKSNVYKKKLKQYKDHLGLSIEQRWEYPNRFEFDVTSRPSRAPFTRCQIHATQDGMVVVSDPSSSAYNKWTKTEVPLAGMLYLFPEGLHSSLPALEFHALWPTTGHFFGIDLDVKPGQVLVGGLKGNAELFALTKSTVRRIAVLKASHSSKVQFFGPTSMLIFSGVPTYRHVSGVRNGQGMPPPSSKDLNKLHNAFQGFHPGFLKGEVDIWSRARPFQLQRAVTAVDTVVEALQSPEGCAAFPRWLSHSCNGGCGRLMANKALEEVFADWDANYKAGSVHAAAYQGNSTGLAQWATALDGVQVQFLKKDKLVSKDGVSAILTKVGICFKKGSASTCCIQKVLPLSDSHGQALFEKALKMW